jgi:hypothetical protein
MHNFLQHLAFADVICVSYGSIFQLCKAKRRECIKNVRTPLSRLCVSASLVVRNYGATNMMPTCHWRGDPISKHINGLGMNLNYVKIPVEARNQDWFCWRIPAAMYCLLSSTVGDRYRMLAYRPEVLVAD